MNPAYGIFTNLLVKSFPGKRKISLIDYGCGTGLFLNYFPNDRLKHYWGYEVNSNSLKSARQKFISSKKIEFLEIKNNMPLKKNSADAIIMIGVLQYLSDEEVSKLLKKARGALKEKGVMLISTVLDRRIYKWPNLYNFILPNRYFYPNKLIEEIEKSGFRVEVSKQRGIIVAPLFSQFFIIFFDAFDKLIFRNKGKLGPIGTLLRKLIYPILVFELKIPINFGYTIYLKSVKE